MKNEESNAKPKGLPGPFPSFPFCFRVGAAAATTAVGSTNEIDHEFYILQASHDTLADDTQYSAYWIAPHGYETAAQVRSNGVPLNRFAPPGERYAGFIQPNGKFTAGPFPKGHAVYYLLVNNDAQAEKKSICAGVIALDIYKDQDYPETRY